MSDKIWYAFSSWKQAVWPRVIQVVGGIWIWLYQFHINSTFPTSDWQGHWFETSSRRDSLWTKMALHCQYLVWWLFYTIIDLNFGWHKDLSTKKNSDVRQRWISLLGVDNIQLLTSILVDIRIYQPEKSDIHQGRKCVMSISVLLFQIWTSAQPRSMINGVWQSLCL